MVCWVSKLKRNAVVKSTTLSTQTTWSGLSARYSVSRSPWTMAIRNQTTAKIIQDKKKEAENQNIVQLHESSIKLVKKSLRNLEMVHKFHLVHWYQPQTCPHPRHRFSRRCWFVHALTQSCSSLTAREERWESRIFFWTDSMMLTYLPPWGVCQKNLLLHESLDLHHKNQFVVDATKNMKN